MYLRISYEVIAILVINASMTSIYYSLQTIARTNPPIEGLALVVKVFFSYSVMLVMLTLFHFKKRGYKLLAIYAVLALATGTSFRDGNLVLARLIPTLAMAMSLLISALHVSEIKKKMPTLSVKLLQIGLGVDAIIALIYPLMSTTTDYIIGFSATAIGAVFTGIGFLAVVKDRFEELKKESPASSSEKT